MPAHGYVRPQRFHLGIVACSAEGAALCYRTVCSEGAAVFGAHAHPEISLHNIPLADYVPPLDASDLDAVAELMLESAHKLAASGAQLLICPDNTIHAALPKVLSRSPLPWLHIAEVVAGEARSRGFTKVGITGTAWLVESDVYPTALGAAGIAFVRPSEPERDAIARIIMDELVYGVISNESLGVFQSAIERMKREGCDAVVLGCTEIPLVVNDRNSPLPTFDSTRLLARAALRYAAMRRP